jgi:preprotein translocase subunit SecA
VTKKEKLEALLRDVETRHKAGQPLLIGTISVEANEELSALLSKKRLMHEVLNAKNQAREAEIIAKAGQKGSITLATNMAGRGTDIKLGPGVVELGGLAVLGTERHEARRIDNQLRGRSGRQGDPGFSRFYISCEDELLVRFGSDKFKTVVGWMKSNVAAGEEVTSKIIQGQVTAAQKKIEGYNFDSRKNLLKYDDVLRYQREIIYKERNNCLFMDSVEQIVLKMISEVSYNYIQDFFKQVGPNKFRIDDQKIIDFYDGTIFEKNTLEKTYLESLDEKQIPKYIHDLLLREFNAKKRFLDDEKFQEYLKVVLLKVIDTYWMRHIDAMSDLRHGVSLQSIGQQNPLIVYQSRGKQLFDEMISNIRKDVVMLINRQKFVVASGAERQKVVSNASTNSQTERNDKHYKRKDYSKGRRY